MVRIQQEVKRALMLSSAVLANLLIPQTATLPISSKSTLLRSTQTNNPVPPLSPQSTVGDLVKERPARSRLFEQLKIDYCCGGKLTLAEACAKQGLEVDAVIREIRLFEAEDASMVNADAMGLGELADHIAGTHHDYLRKELPRIASLTRKVVAVHGNDEPRLRRIHELFFELQAEMTEHMFKEERILFPMIKQIETAESVPDFHCGTLANPIRQMEHEHESAGDALKQLRELSDDYTPPEWACNTFRALYEALAGLEMDMHQHVHKENNVLFPKALRRETELNRSIGA